MFDAEKGQAGQLKGQSLAIGIVQARFNESITDALAAACIAELNCTAWMPRAFTMSRYRAHSKCRWPCRRWPKPKTMTR